MSTDTELDSKLIAAAFALAGEVGWAKVSVAEAARRAEMPLDQARARFSGSRAVLCRFGRLADQAALAGADATPDASTRDRLFDILMRRLDVLQAHRAGTLALFRELPSDPATAMMLAAASLRSMGWMLEGAGLASTGLRGMLRAKGLLAVWLYTVRAWRGDESEDMSATMSALDRALDRAEQVEGWLGKRNASPVPDAEFSPEPEVTAETLPNTRGNETATPISH